MRQSMGPMAAAAVFGACLLSTAPLAQSGSSPAPNWPGFRGTSSAGVTADDAVFPTTFAPDAPSMAWQLQVSDGHSSPVIWGDAVFLTGSNQDAGWLEVLRIDRLTGQVVWRQELHVDAFQNVHEGVGTVADSTPITDGERVYAYFGSLGVVAFDFDGQEQWRVPLPVVQMAFGGGTSPALAGDRLILSREGREQYLLALDTRSGEQVWRQEHEGYGCGVGHSTPVVSGNEIVMNRCGEMAGFDAATGARRWWLRWGSGSGDTTPVVADDMVFATAWANLGEPDLLVKIPGYEEVWRERDLDGDGVLSETEFPTVIRMARIDAGDVNGAQWPVLFQAFDRNRDGLIDTGEWTRRQAALNAPGQIDHGLIAVRSDGAGALTEEAIAWKEVRGVSEVPSPLLYRGKVYMVTNGGIVSTMDAASGRLIYRGRLGSPGLYYSSPVASGGRIYFASGEGMLTVITDGDTLEVVSRNDLGEPIFATPALVDGHVYVRTRHHLYAFGPGR